MDSIMPTHAELFGTTTNPCPTWCALPTGHGYESADALAQFRYHELHLIAPTLTRQAPDVQGALGHAPYEPTVAIVAGETRRIADGQVALEAPRVSVDLGDAELDVGEVRALAAVLLAAADKLEQVTA